MDPREIELDVKIKHIKSMFATLNKLHEHYESQKKNAATHAKDEFAALMCRLRSS